MTVVAKVYTPGGALIATLSGDTARAWEAELNGAGSGSLELQRSDADLALIDFEDVVRFELDGTPRFAFIVEHEARDTIATGEEPAEVVTLSGRGLLAAWESAVVYPELGVLKRSPDTRRFDFTSSDYVEGAVWDPAVQIKLQSAVGTTLFPSGQWAGAPADWPDPTAYWIWSRQQVNNSPPQPVGLCYFRKVFTVAAATAARIFWTGDDGVAIYLDGELIEAETRAFLWNERKHTDLYLESGSHVIAIRGENILRPAASANVAGVICAVMTVTNGGAGVGTVITHTDSTWSALDYPLRAPTMTPGEILSVLLSEAQARGKLTGWSLGTTATLDSDGAAWATPVDVSFPVGTTYSEVIATLVEQAIDVNVDFTLPRLHAYNKDTFGSDLTASVSLLRGTHLLSLDHDTETLAANAIIAKDAEGVWREDTDAGSITTWTRKEGFVSLATAASSDQVHTAIEGIFADHSEITSTASFETLAIAGDAPYVDWGLGDTILVPSRGGAVTATRIRRLAVYEDDAAADGSVGGAQRYRAEGRQGLTGGS